MPAAFDKCVSSGGQVRTKSLPNGEYMHICFMNGKSYAGEVKKKKERLMLHQKIARGMSPRE